MEKAEPKSARQISLFWGTVIILLLVAIALSDMFREEERALRVSTQEQLGIVQKNLRETAVAKAKVEGELTIEKGRGNVLKAELDQKKREIRITLNQLEGERGARRQVETQLVRTLEEKRALEETIKTLARAPKIIELEKIIVESVVDLVGEVSEVNEEYGFIVANLGRKNNLKIGDILSVYRNDEIVGKAQVEKVEDEFCAAAILFDWQDGDFRENDLVKAWK